MRSVCSADNIREPLEEGAFSAGPSLPYAGRCWVDSCVVIQSAHLRTPAHVARVPCWLGSVLVGLGAHLGAERPRFCRLG